MKIIINGFIVYLFIASQILAQKSIPIKDPLVLKSLDKVLVESYPHLYDTISVVEAFRIDDNYSKVIYSIEGRLKEEFIYDSDGDMVIIASLLEIPIVNIPLIVRDAFKAQNKGGWEILNAFEVRPNYGGAQYYGLELGKGEKLKRLYYDNFGNIHKGPY